MKLTLVLFFVAAFVGCALSAPLDYSCTPESYAAYKAHYTKSYATPADEQLHYNIFCDKLKTIDEHNTKFEKGEVTFEMGVNQFTDMTSKEIAESIG
ncbi:cathepsin L-like proteinase [Eupeodes corollae]|uniref:cathepsin L-like proteinase n=1 Tax=Eupeodes corollae TaxID=290404 RepID=UPI0024905C9E|nr:cathepsin L-like proteinase [Eupeodes corollae]